MKHFNGRPIRNTASRFKGVYKMQGKECWGAQFFLAKGKSVLLGTFDTEEDAARAYDAAALHYRGPTAFQNMRDMQAKTEPIIDGPVTRVPLNTGEHFLIDTEDLDIVSAYYWTLSKGRGLIHGNCGASLRTKLHVLLLGKMRKGHWPIHINGDRMDYRKSNLATVPLVLHFGRHRKVTGRCQSIYKGVKRRSENSWQARIVRQHLGSFDNEVDAALAYDAAARRKYGIFAALNFPREGEVSCLPSEREKHAGEYQLRSLERDKTAA